MNQSQETAFKTLQFYTTASYPCSYLGGQIARSQVVTPAHLIDTPSYSALMRRGFRRSGLFFYRPHCDHCQACLSLRLPVADFQPDRSQKRAWTRHQDLQITIKPPLFSSEHFALYQRYQQARHHGGGMDADDVAQYQDFLIDSHVHSMLIEFRQTSHNDDPGVLKMVSILDRLDDGMSAVYTFYEPEPGQCYGTYNVLWQINQASAWGLKYLYLGYWVAQSRKMSYKMRFKPFELLVQNQWRAMIDLTDITALMSENFHKIK
ncbi:MAG: arginyltransferase [Betaproteobacteria bacterium HGW-Betaproteobacteria-18]|nr:MAG: arginyltransferase [Betaproteobacteria bacterium HGW-Betaproteobacteria-18]